MIRLSSHKIFIGISGILALTGFSLLTGCQTYRPNIPDPENHKFYSNPKAKNLLVYVHGFGSGPIKAWKNAETHFYWPKRFSLEPDLKDYDVFSFGYTKVPQCMSSLDISGVSKKLNLAVKERLREKSYQSISFVAHGPGGIAVRQWILDYFDSPSQNLNQPHLENVILLGVPNKGAALGKTFLHYCKNKAFETFKVGRDSYLYSLNNRWRSKFPGPSSAKSFKYSAAYETLGTELADGKREILVPRDEAKYLTHDSLYFFKNHSELAKPFGADDPLFLWVKRHFTPLSGAQQARLNQYFSDQERAREILDQLAKELGPNELDEAYRFVSKDDWDGLVGLLDKHELKPYASVAITRFIQAQIHERHFNYSQARTDYARAAKLSPKKAWYQKKAGDLHFLLAEYDAAVEFYSKAEAIQKNKSERVPPTLADIWNSLGVTWKEKGDYDKALAYLSNALESDKKQYGSSHPKLARDWNNLGAVWAAKGDFEKAIELNQKAIQLNTQTLGPRHPRVAIGWSNLGNVWNSKGDPAKAIEYHHKAIAIAKEAFGEKHTSVARVWNNLAATFSSQGDYNKAIEYLEKALQVELETLWPQHPSVAGVWNNLADAWSSKGHYPKAIQYLEKARGVYVKTGLNHRVQLVDHNLKANHMKMEAESQSLF